MERERRQRVFFPPSFPFENEGAGDSEDGGRQTSFFFFFFFPAATKTVSQPLLSSFYPLPALRRSLFHPLSQLLKPFRCVDLSLNVCCRKGNGALSSPWRSRSVVLSLLTFFFSLACERDRWCRVAASFNTEEEKESIGAFFFHHPALAAP